VVRDHVLGVSAGLPTAGPRTRTWGGSLEGAKTSVFPPTWH
jgi:hypothetical protein